MWTLDGILDVLNTEQLRATYGAVADVLGVHPRGLMQNSPLDPRHSWVVAQDTGLPTGYRDEQVHEALKRLPIVLDTRERLQRVLDRNPPPR